MALSTTTPSASALGRPMAETDHTPRSAVSWSAVIAGAAAAASLSLILLILGVGLGLSSVSPWAREGVGATTFGASTILWLTLTQLLASAMGGYLAGRLRTRWTDASGDEVYFRDTAHGFLAWAVASLATAALLTSVIGSILGSGVQAGATALGGTAGAAVAVTSAPVRMAAGAAGEPLAYFVDSLFRQPTPGSTAMADAAALAPESGNRAGLQEAAEITRIFMNVRGTEPLPPEDLRYVGQLVVQRTGLALPEAEQRVAAVLARAQATLQSAEATARAAADKARKASAYSALWLFVSLLVGAFVASLAATFGGRLRDR